MTTSRLAAWTRRRLGFVVGGTAAQIWLPTADDASARKKKKKCKKSEKRCGKKCVKGTCCPGKACGGGECQCTRTVEGKPFCKPSDARLGLICGGAGSCPACAASDTCEDDFKCVQDETFGALVICQPPCGFEI